MRDAEWNDEMCRELVKNALQTDNKRQTDKTGIGNASI